MSTTQIEPDKVMSRGERTVQWRTGLTEEPDTKRCKVSRKMMIPAGFDYLNLLIGPGGSKINALRAEVGNRVKIVVCDDKTWHKRIDEPPHVLLEGESSSVDKVESFLNDLWKFQKISRKIMLPLGYDYLKLIGYGASGVQKLEIDAGGQIKIEVRGNNRRGRYYSPEPMHVFMEGEASCVDNAESLVMDLLKISGREIMTRSGNTMDFHEPIVANANSYDNGRSVIDRVHALINDIGLNINPDETLGSKVITLENEVFGKTKSGTIKERVSSLEKEMG